MLEPLGLTMTGAVTIFLKAVIREQGLPFGISLKQDDLTELNEEADK